MRFKRLSRVLAAAAFAAYVAGSVPAFALFGFGGKKNTDQSQSQSADDGNQSAAGSQLPGMGSGEDQGSGGMAPPSTPAVPPSAETSAETGASDSGTSAATGAAQDESGNANADSAGAPPASLSGSGTGLPQEVVIKGAEGSGAKIHGTKPPLNIDVDPFESIRPSLEPDQTLLLAESPFTVSWRRTYPEFLKNDRVVQPWRTTFSDRQGVVFNVRDQLSEALQRPLDEREARGYQWSLTIADEEGRVFQHYEGSKDPPAELVWNGQNDQGEWIKAGKSYSAIYMFTDSSGAPHTKVGKPILFTGIAHQEPDGLHISLDSSVLFGQSKDARDLQHGGDALLRSAADLIKRRYTGIPIRVVAYSSTKELAEVQAGIAQVYLMQELMIMPAQISSDADHAQFSEQRVEIVLLNR